MEEVFYQFPAYTLEIVEKLTRADWIIHSYDFENKADCYNPAGFLYNSEFNGIEYVIHLDLNVYQYVLSAFKKNKKKDLHRDAVALMVFGKFTNVVFDPTLAVYEKLNYLEQCPDEIINDLILFREIDNSDIDGLARFALGYTDEIHLSEAVTIDNKEMKLELTRYKRLKKWDTFYLIILEITKLYYFDDSSSEEKIARFLKWNFSDFLYSLVAISFLVRLMGKKPLPKLMKYRPNFSIEKKKDALVNMTWDLFLLDKFFEDWVNKPKNREFLYASNDKPLKHILELAISIQVKESCYHLNEYISASIIKEISEIPDKMKLTKGRSISGVKDLKSYRDGLIKKNEQIVLTE
jgi:hypothetical protein